MCVHISEYLPNHVKGPPSLLQNSDSLFSPPPRISLTPILIVTDFHLTSLFGTSDSLTGDVAAAGAWQAGRNKKWVEVKGRDMAALVSGILLVSLRSDGDGVPSVFSLDSFGVRLLYLVSVLPFGW